jgi:DNA-binding NtrC family response regulator
MKSHDERSVHDAETHDAKTHDERGLDTGPGKAPEVRVRSLREVELEHVRFALRACSGNKSQTAQALGISRDTLYRKIAEFELAASEHTVTGDAERGTRGE